MLYSEKFNLLFIAVPKTGSSSFAKTFVDVLGARKNEVKSGDHWIKCGTHDSLRDISSYVGWENLAEMTIVGGVRNPWDIMVSSYYFYKNGRASIKVMSGKRRKPISILNVLLAKVLPFSLWVFITRKKSCMYYLKDAKGNIGVDHVIRLENMSEDIESLCKDLGISVQEMVHENKSSHKRYKQYYNPISQKIVTRRFSKDIAEFGYEF